MANLTREQEAMNRAHSDNRSTCLPNCWRWHYGDPPQPSYSSSRAKAYNAVHGTRIVDDATLDKYLENEAEIKRALR